jgi:hypothetical protein
MEELKTLKDFEGKPFEGVGCDCGCCSTMAINGDKLREEAIKWVKEDKRRIAIGNINVDILLRKWMVRLNLTNDDLN